MDIPTEQPVAVAITAMSTNRLTQCLCFMAYPQDIRSSGHCTFFPQGVKPCGGTSTDARAYARTPSKKGQTMTTANLSLAHDPQKLGLLLAAVALVASPHVLNLAPAVMAFFGVLAVWRVAVLYLGLRLPNKALLFFLTLTGGAIVLGHYHRFWGQEAGSSLFIIGLGLKLMELKTLRDAYLVIFLAFFVALTQYLFSQSIPMAGYTLAVVVLLVASMIGLNSNAAFPLRARLKLAGLMVAQALPAMALLFVFFPRIQGPLWEFPDDTHAAKTGLSDTLSPGSVTHLALSQETAFRVDFEGRTPPTRSLYWRGPVFWATNGHGWMTSPGISLAPARKPRFAGESLSYTVTLEPHGQHWIFALELPDSFPQEFTETADYQLLAKEPVIERKQYRISSRTAQTTGPLSESEARRALQLPAERSAKLEALVEAWTRENPGPRQLVDRALRYFREEPFFYTLNPPPSEGDPAENFLLETRRGFCEHFATAFVVLMRMGGVPARVVTGYQGGQWNDIGHFLEVKQANAHAWAEVWLEPSGWTRVDPTAAVAPERIERGLDMDTQLSAGEVRFNLGEGRAGAEGFGWVRVWRGIRMIGSSIDHAWASWILAYGSDSQAHFMQWLGLLDWRSVAAWLGLGMVVFALGLAWAILPKRQASPDPAKRVYEHFLTKLARWDLVPQTGEGPVSFAERAAQAVPDLADSFRLISRLYLQIRYERSHGPNDLKHLRRIVAALPKPRIRWRERLAGRLRTGGF